MTSWDKVPHREHVPSPEQKLLPILDLLADLKEKYGRDPDPLRTLLELGMGYDKAANVPEGVPVPLNVRIEALKASSRYVRPQLGQIAVTGADGGPIKIEAAVAKRIGTDEELRRLAEDFAIQMAQKTVDVKAELQAAETLED